jgi:VanZ family protein
MSITTLFRSATLVWFFATLLVLGVPSNVVPSSGIPYADKFAHTLIFACGSFVAMRGWPNRKLSVVGFVVLFALLAELWQLLLPTHRHSDTMDTLANIIGVTVGATVALLTLRMRGTRG